MPNAGPRPAPVALPNDPPITEALVRRHKLTPGEYERILERLGRAPTYAELGVLSVMWSEHCSYKSSRVHLARLPTEGPRVVQGPGENAGVVDIGDGFVAVFKMESHNHPSYIEPYQGAATGVGGILRDVFTMGARPVAVLDSLRFGRPDHPRTPELLRGVVSGISGYGNAFGVPTVGGELFFDGAYDGNILVNAMALGVAPADGIFYGRASGVKNPVLYVGAKTGRDGIHGATMASDEFSAGGPSQRPTVQVGDPFMEKLLLEACLEIFAEDLLVGVQDMGAAGLTSSSVEMAGRSGSGLDLDLDRVPRRARGMSPYEMLLSESQERMLMVAKPGKEARVREICEKWELDAVVIGQVTDTGRWVVRATPGFDPLAPGGPARPGAGVEREGVVVCDLPVSLLTDDAPKYERPMAEDPRLLARLAFDPASIPEPASPSAMRRAVLEMAGSPNLGSRAWVYRQFDHIVRGGTVVGPGGDAAVVRVPCEGAEGARKDKLLALAADCSGRLCALDPEAGAAMAVAEVCRNLVCVGAEPLGLTDCLNFGSPERPEVAWQLSRAIDGIARACLALSVPVVSGNVSLYNETDGRAIHPTPTIGAVGLVRDPGDIVRAFFPEPGLEVLLLGPPRGGPLGGSEWVARQVGGALGRPPSIDLDLEARLQALLLEALRERPQLASSAHDVSDGGIATALCECAAGSEGAPGARLDVGAEIDLAPLLGKGGSASLAEALFGEAPSRILVSARPAEASRLLALAAARAVPASRLGRTGGDALVLRAGPDLACSIPVSEIRAAREACLEPALGRPAR